MSTDPILTNPEPVEDCPDSKAQVSQLSSAARRALAHIRARTISGKFACPLWDMTTQTWDSALVELRLAGYPVVWTSGRVLDNPTVTGGYVLR